MNKIALGLCTFTAALLTACQMPANGQLPDSTAWIAKDLGLKQCEQGLAKTALDQQQMLLKQHRVKVNHAHCANDGMMRIQMCGAPQGILGIYQIKTMQLQQVQSLGFQQVQAEQYQQTACS